MADALVWHRLQFAFTIMYHYLFPQLTMGLALLIVVLKALHLRRRDEAYAEAARFWARIFGINFAVGVVTGIPMEFQFGTNWARFSNFAGGVIGQTLAMEGMFAFFARVGVPGPLPLRREAARPAGAPRAAAHGSSSGRWLSGYFIIATNAFMQHPVGHAVGADGALAARRLLGLPAQPLGALAVRAQHVRRGRHRVVRRGRASAPTGRSRAAPRARARLPAVGVIAGLVAALLVSCSRPATSTGRWSREHQPATLAAMEGRSRAAPSAELAIIGQPDVAAAAAGEPDRRARRC